MAVFSGVVVFCDHKDEKGASDCAQYEYACIVPRPENNTTEVLFVGQRAEDVEAGRVWGVTQSPIITEGKQPGPLFMCPRHVPQRPAPAPVAAQQPTQAGPRVLRPVRR